MSTPRQTSRSMPERKIPDANVLDLRKIRQSRIPESRQSVLETFWKRSGERRAPRREDQRGTHWGIVRARVIVLVRQYRLGAFPFLAGLVLLAFIVITALGQVMNVRADVLQFASAGYASLKIASAKAEERDLTAAAAALKNAAEHFSAAEASFDELDPTIAAVLSRLPIAGEKFRSSQHLLTAARLMSDAGSKFSTLAVPLASSGEGFSATANFLENLTREEQSLKVVTTDIQQALDELSVVRANDLPQPYRTAFAQFQRALPGLKSSLGAVNDGTSVLSHLFGVEQPVEYLYAFQNANELRATGGFLGSFALIRLDHGEFKILDAPNRGSLGVDDYLPKTITPPLPLQVITPSWYFRDANWYPDFPTSAEQMVRFYEQARGFRPDGVIALTNTFLERILRVIGPVEVPSYGVTVDAQNFTRLTQEQVETNYDLRVNDPKKFIVDLVPVLAGRLSQLELRQYPALLAAVVESISAGELQLWSADPATEASITKLGWAGTMPDATGDFFELVDTNVGGGKTDAVIDVKIRDLITIQDDGRVFATVEVTRTHQGDPADLFSGNRNRTYHRLYLPAGSKLMSAEGFSRLSADVFRRLPIGSRPDEFFKSVEGRVTIDEQSGTRMNDEFGKTVFGNWTELDPGQSATFRYVYELPLSLNADLERYDLTIGKQAGANRSVEVVVTVPKGQDIAWVSDDEAQVADGSLTFSTDLRHAENLSFVIKK